MTRIGLPATELCCSVTSRGELTSDRAARIDHAQSGFFTSSSISLKKSSSVGAFLGFGGALKVLGNHVVEFGLVGGEAFDDGRSAFGPLGLGLVGVEAGEVHERVSLAARARRLRRGLCESSGTPRGRPGRSRS